MEENLKSFQNLILTATQVGNKPRLMQICLKQLVITLYALRSSANNEKLQLNSEETSFTYTEKSNGPSHRRTQLLV